MEKINYDKFYEKFPEYAGVKEKHRTVKNIIKAENEGNYKKIGVELMYLIPDEEARDFFATFMADKRSAKKAGTWNKETWRDEYICAKCIEWVNA